MECNLSLFLKQVCDPLVYLLNWTVLSDFPIIRETLLDFRIGAYVPPAVTHFATSQSVVTHSHLDFSS